MFADKTMLYLRDEMRIFVEIALPKLLDQMRGREKDKLRLADQLCDHAAFTSEDTGIKFYHPMYRDYFASRRWSERIRAGDFRKLDARDLSESAVLFLAQMLPRATIRTLGVTGLARTSEAQIVRNTLTLIDVFVRLTHPADNQPALQRELFKQLVPAAPTLSSRDLSNIRLRGADLREATLARSNLDGAEFIQCDLRNVRFDGAMLRMTLFDRCQLDGATFHDLTEFVNVRFDPAGEAITDIDTVRMHLLKAGADLGGPVELEPPAHSAVRQLLVNQFRRFKPEGRSTWTRTRRMDSLLHGLHGKERNFVERQLIPELVSIGVYQRGVAKGGPFVKLTNTTDPAALLERDLVAVSLRGVIDRLAGPAERLLEL